jgi:hypothetical protein
MDEVIADTVAEHLVRYNRDYSGNITKEDLRGKWIWDVVAIDRHPRLEEYLRSDDFFADLDVIPDEWGSCLSTVTTTGCVLQSNRRERDGLYRVGRVTTACCSKPQKEQTATARVAAIEAEGEFIQIGIQMRGCNRSLMRAEQPAFEQRSNAMHPRHGNVRRIAAAGNVGHSVPVSLFGKAVVTFPAVGVNF